MNPKPCPGYKHDDDAQGFCKLCGGLRQEHEPTPSPQPQPLREQGDSLRKQIEALPRFAYMEIYRDQWPGDTKGIYQREDGDLLSRAAVLALLDGDTKEPEK